MKKYVLGMDIGGTNVRTSLLDLEHDNIVDRYSKPLVPYPSGEDEIRHNIVNVIEQRLRRLHIETTLLSGAGVSIAALFDRQSGVITQWPNRPSWDRFPFRDYVSNTLNLPVRMEDDANCAALGEMYQGSARGLKQFVYINIGTGIGCGIVINGKLHIGEQGWAGELGHTTMAMDGPDCVCGLKGCLQAFVSGRALLKAGQSSGKINGIEVNSLHQLFSYADQQVHWAKAIIHEAGVMLAIAVYNLTKMLDINTIILGGGVIHSSPLIPAAIEEGLKWRYGAKARHIRILTSQLGNDSGVIGALYIGRDQAVKCRRGDDLVENDHF